LRLAAGPLDANPRVSISTIADACRARKCGRAECLLPVIAAGTLRHHQAVFGYHCAARRRIFSPKFDLRRSLARAERRGHLRAVLC